MVFKRGGVHPPNTKEFGRPNALKPNRTRRAVAVTVTTHDAYSSLTLTREGRHVVASSNICFILL